MILQTLSSISQALCGLPSTLCLTGDLWHYSSFGSMIYIRVTYCQSSSLSFVSTQYSFCNSFRHGPLCKERGLIFSGGFGRKWNVDQYQKVCRILYYFSPGTWHPTIHYFKGPAYIERSWSFWAAVAALAAASQTKPQTEHLYLKKIHCCWRLVDRQEDSLDFASRLSSILLELCEVEVFLLSWLGQSQSSYPRTSLGKYSPRRCRSYPRY